MWGIITGWFSGAKVWIYGVAVAIVSGMWFYIKYLVSKNARLEHEAKTKDKIKENHDKQEADEIEVLDNEEKNIQTDLQEHRDKSRSERASRL